MELPFFLQAFKIRLAQRLVDGNRRRVAQVQRPRAPVHRNTQAGCFVLHQQFFRQTFRFLAKDQKIPVTELHVRMTMSGFGRKEEKP